MAEANMTAEQERRMFRKKMRAKAFVYWFVIVPGWYILLILCTFLMAPWNMQVLPGLSWGEASLGLLILYTIGSLGIKKPEEILNIDVFGSPFVEYKNWTGLYFAPLLLTRVVRMTRNQIQLDMGTPPRKPDSDERVVLKTDEENAVYVIPEPMRMPTASPETADYELIGDPDPDQHHLDPELHKRMTIDPRTTSFWEIESLVAFRRRAGSIEAMNRQIYQVAVSALIEIIGKLTPAMLIGNQAVVNAHVTRKIETRIGERDPDQDEENQKGGSIRYPWLGANFVSTQVTDWGLPRRVSVSQADVGKAVYTAQATVLAAGAEETRLTKEGTGKASARRAFLFAEAEARERLLKAEATGRKLLVEATDTEAGKLLAYLETIGTALKESQHSTIFSNGLLDGSVLQAVAGIESMLQGRGRRPLPPEPTQPPPPTPQPSPTT